MFLFCHPAAKYAMPPGMRQENKTMVVSYQQPAQSGRSGSSAPLNMNKNEIIASFAFAKKGANIHMEEGERGHYQRKPLEIKFSPL